MVDTESGQAESTEQAISCTAAANVEICRRQPFQSLKAFKLILATIDKP
jgi:hypothetical protein